MNALALFAAAFVISSPKYSFARNNNPQPYSYATKHKMEVASANQKDDSDYATTEEEKLWFPLESNPALLNRYISKLGFDTSNHAFADVLSTEQWALDMVPQPVSAVVVLFPMTSKILCQRRELHSDSISARKEEDGDILYDGVWYMKQRIRNACGTIAILHALANTPASIRASSVQPSSWLHSFLLKSSCPTSASNSGSTTPTAADKAAMLESDATIESFHEDATNDTSNQTSRGNKEDSIDLHFVAFVHVGGKLFELDGRVEEGPICHGKTTQESLLKDACEYVKKMMDADPNEMRFTIMAFAPKE